jgi:predicted anti-sigma-YlaC factor YlaD
MSDDTTPVDDLPCQAFVELVTDYFEGALDPPVVERVDEHIEICRGCRMYLDQLHATIELTGHLLESDVEALPDDARAELFRAFREALGP